MRLRKILLSILILLLLLSFSIGANSYQNIYSKKSSEFIYSPFKLETNPMERLLIIDFKDDPDKIYYCFEIQVFEDKTTGQGIRIIAYRNDGYIDVYQQPGLSTNKNFDNIGKGLADLMKRPMNQAKFKATSRGVDVYFNLKDKLGRRIKVKINEKTEKEINSFDVLAPIGNSANDPSSLPLFFLYDFYFVRKDNTDIKIQVGKNKHQPDNLPMPLDWSMCYFTRYSADPFLVEWNSVCQGGLSPLKIEEAGRIKNKGVTYQIINNKDHFEIKTMTAANESHQVKIKCSPAIPDIRSLKAEVDIKGDFIITSDRSIGTVSGEYQLQREGDNVIFKIHPSGGWEPNESRWSLKFMYLVAPVFKNWSKSYIWTAKIKLNESTSTQAIIKSNWERKK